MSERSERLQSILVSYIEAAEVGRAPGRDELLAHHPEFAAELAEFLDGRERIRRAVPAPAEMPTLAPGEPAPAAPLATVRYFGDYELLEEIARGGMGVVYRVRQVSVNRVVAIKMILAGQLASKEEVRRFKTEAEAAANLDHPNIVPIYEVGEHNGQHYFSMKLIDGGSLAASRRDARSRASLRDAAKLVATVARAVHHAHQRGILHRDLKPGNVLLDVAGEPHVTDFGLARKIEGDSRLTQSGAIVGTPSYMAPEQASGKKGLTVAADVYSLGAILYELLTGRPPFQAATPLDTLLQVLDREPERPRALDPTIDRDLETICLKCLDKEPGRRYDSAAALADDLRHWLDGEPILARPIGGWERGVKWVRRRPAVAGLLASLAVVTLLGFGLVTWKWLEATAARAAAEQSQQDALASAAQARQAEALAKGKAEEARQAEEFAKGKAGEALQAQQAAQGANTKTQQALRVAERSGYALQIALAQREARDNNIGQALAALAATAPPLRHWEHGYLTALCQRRMDRLRSGLLVTAVAFSADGRRVAAAFYHGGGARVWDTTTRREVLTVRDQGQFTGVAFSPDGKRLASAGADGAVRLWAVDGGQRLFDLRGHTSQVHGVAFSPDGRRLASAGADGTVRLWDADTGKQALSLKGHTGAARAVAFSPDGERVASAGDDGMARVWDLARGQEVFHFKADGGWVRGIAFSPDGTRLATGGDDRLVKVWDAKTGQESFTLKGHVSWVNGVAFSRDGRRLASASEDGTVKVWELGPVQEPLTLRGPAEPVQCVAFHPDGKVLASGGGEVLRYQGELLLWGLDAGPETLVRKLPIAPGPSPGIGLSPDGEQVAFCGNRSAVTLCELATGKENTLPGGPAAYFLQLAFSPDGKLLAGGTLAKGGKDLRILEVGTGKEVFARPGLGEAVAFSPDGKHLAGTADGVVKVLEVAGGREVHALGGHWGGITALAWSSDSARLAAAGGVLSQPKEVKVWDAATGREVCTFRGHTGFIYAVAFSPDGRLVVSGAQDGLKVWDAAGGELLHTLTDHSGWVFRVAFTPDGERLACSNGQFGRQAEVTVREMRTWQKVLTLKGEASPVVALAFRRDGKRLIGVSVDGTAKVWDATPSP